MQFSGKNRRKGPDIWVKLTRLSALLGWVIFILAIIVSFYAAPEESYGLVRYHNIEIRHFWDKPMTNYLYALLWFSALMSLVSLAINQYRNRRASDSIYFNAILLVLTCVAWLAYIYVNI